MQGSGHFAIAANSIEGRDARWHLHPNTDARQHERTGPLMIVRGSGVHVFDNTGKRYIEAMSGLWSAALGFSETRLADAAYRQMRELPFYHNFNHRAVAPATDLAERLVALAPVPMSKVFFTNSGSEANDTALKMIWYRANAMGQGAKKKVIARRRGFHGVTIGAASLTGLPMNHGAFDLPIPQIRHVTCPHHWREALPGESEEAFASRLAEELDRHREKDVALSDDRFSSIARNQLQAMQMTFFFFLPSMLLSGFMFPFRGMPEWAQVVGNVLPLTHFLVLVRGILLKGNGIDMVWSSVWPILAFIAVVLGIGLRTFRRTLD